MNEYFIHQQRCSKVKTAKSRTVSTGRKGPEALHGRRSAANARAVTRSQLTYETDRRRVYAGHLAAAVTAACCHSSACSCRPMHQPASCTASLLTAIAAHRACSVCQHTGASLANTDEPIQMSFATWTPVGLENHVLGGGPNRPPRGKDNLEVGGHFRRHLKTFLFNCLDS